MPRRRAAAEPTRICFHKVAGTRYRATIHRTDGAVVALEGGSWNRIGGPVARVPHDLAHLVVEQGLGLERGLWGVLAAGGLVQNAAYAGGRRPPHALAQAKRITDAAGEELRRAEVLVPAIADPTRTTRGRVELNALRAAVGERWWHPALTAETFDAIASGLRDAVRAWDVLAPGSALVRTWRSGERRITAS